MRLAKVSIATTWQFNFSLFPVGFHHFVAGAVSINSPINILQTNISDFASQETDLRQLAPGIVVEN